MRKHRNQRAFTLVEVLLAVAMMAALLAAVAAGVHASFHSYAENEDIATATQSTRAILTRLTTEVRTAAAVDSTDTQLTIIPPDDGSGIEQVQYEFTGGTLYYRQTINGSTASYVLLGPGDEAAVTTFHVLREVGLDWQGLPCTKSITVRLELHADNAPLAMTVSAAPRRNQDY